MELDDQTLRDTVESIVESMLGPGLEWRLGTVSESCIQVAIAVSGDVNAQVVLTGDDAFARRVAMMMFELPSSELTADDIADAFRELTNMTGGAIKSMLDGTCQLGLPEVRPEPLPLVDTEAWSARLEHEGDALEVHVLFKESSLVA